MIHPKRTDKPIPPPAIEIAQWKGVPKTLDGAAIRLLINEPPSTTGFSEDGAPVRIIRFAPPTPKIEE
jgi:hypothetical protein